MPYIRDDIKDRMGRLSQRYADRMEEHSNILMKNFIRSIKTSRRLKERLPQDYVPDRCNSIGDMLMLGDMLMGIYSSRLFITLNYHMYH